MPEPETITLDQLCVGLYISLDMRWMDHPFTFGHFRIKSEAQIQTLHGLGKSHFRYSPELSQGVLPLPVAGALDRGGNDAAPADSGPSSAVIAKRAMREKVLALQASAQKVEKAFVDSAHAIRDIEKSLYSNPKEAVRQSAQLVTRIADSILKSPELAIHVMGDSSDGEDLYFHSLNVTMLSMMVARDLGLPVEVAGALGMGALMHDIGHKEVPNTIRLKTAPWTQAERNFYEMHCQFGVKTGQHLHLAAAALKIIAEHHELADGSGYPAKLKGEAIGLLSRIVIIANTYDELCNPPQLEKALTPHEALSHMFTKMADKFDAKLLQVFIRCLGVYPPGTIVKLANGNFVSYGMVTTVNTVRPTKPIVVVYEIGVSKAEAIMIDLDDDPDTTIVAALRPSQVPAELLEHLSPRKHVNFYAAGAPAKQSPKGV